VGAKLELVPSPADRPAIVDEYGRLDASIDWDGVRRHASLERTIRGWYENSDPASGFSVSGSSYRVTLGPRGMQRRIISMTKLSQRLGRGVFFRHCSFALGKLEELLTGAEVEEHTITEQTGGRKIQASAIVDLKRAA
jgi:hypothetical protein